MLLLEGQTFTPHGTDSIGIIENVGPQRGNPIVRFHYKHDPQRHYTADAKWLKAIAQ